MNSLPVIRVVCAVIRKGDLYLACQRSESMREPLRWEFPGGKVESGESLMTALHREVHEELVAKVAVRGILRPCTVEQNQKVIRLEPFLCVLVREEFELKEHRACRWLAAKDFHELDFCDADLEILELVQMSGLEETLWWVG